MKIYEVVSNLINRDITIPYSIEEIPESCARKIFNKDFDCSNMSCRECYATEMEEMYKRK